MALPAHWTPDDEVDEPERWLGSSPLLDLEDPKLRLRVRSLVGPGGRLGRGDTAVDALVAGRRERGPNR